MMLQQLQYDANVGREVLERRDTHYIAGIFLVLVLSSTIRQDQHCVRSRRLVNKRTEFAFVHCQHHHHHHDL